MVCCDIKQVQMSCHFLLMKKLILIYISNSLFLYNIFSPFKNTSYSWITFFSKTQKFKYMLPNLLDKVSKFKIFCWISLKNFKMNFFAENMHKSLLLYFFPDLFEREINQQINKEKITKRKKFTDIKHAFYMQNIE